MKIAVVILNYNSSVDCAKCVSFLKRQEELDMEIIVVDNCSDEEDLAKLRALCKEDSQCILIENHENRGYNAGNNIGLRYAAQKGYKYALIANPDMEFPQEDYISKMVKKMESDENIVVLGTDIISPERIHQNPVIRDGDWRSSLRWIKDIFTRTSDSNSFIDNYRKNHYCSKLSGCCLMVRMDFISSIGFFDENVFLYCEEPILSRQVESNGKKMYYLADTQAVHAHIKSAKGNPVKRFKYWRNSRFYFIERYSGDSSLGKAIAKSSAYFYVATFILLHKLKK